MSEEKIRKVPKGMIFKDIGQTGLEDRPANNQEDFLSRFKGQQFYKTIEEMTHNEPVIGASSFCIKKLIKQAPVKIKPGSDLPEDIAAAEFCETARLDMSQTWSHFLEESLTFVDYGFAPHEINYKIRRGQKHNRPSDRSEHNDSKIGWRNMPIRAQKSVFEWTYDKTNRQELSGMWQITTSFGKSGRPSKVWIPIDKLLLFRTGVYKDNPQGQSIYRRAYVPYFYKKELQRIQSIGYERSHAGLPVARVPVDIMTADATDEQKALFAEFKRLVSTVRQDEQAGIVIPSEYDDQGNLIYDFELMSSQGTVDEGIEITINRYSLEILMTTLTDLLLLGHGENGSFALASSKTSMFAIAASNYMREIENVFNRHAIPRLLEYNKMPYTKLPKLEFGDIEIADLEVLSMMVKNLADAGWDLTDVEDDLRKRMGIAAKTDSEPAFTQREAAESNKLKEITDDKQNSD